ncbi:MAG TPA: winged helix-turn-helix domain-containing protein, partial [Mycobacteriales bacterium]|nr:winged helix-turn-helix domain-containing protein [Mycobacteriales bacterium]
HDGEITARVDLKADRKAGVLRVAAAWVEPGAVPGRTAEALALELRRAATWQGLGEVVVEDRGDLARELRAELRAPRPG